MKELGKDVPLNKNERLFAGKQLAEAWGKINNVSVFINDGRGGEIELLKVEPRIQHYGGKIQPRKNTGD